MACLEMKETIGNTLFRRMLIILLLILPIGMYGQRHLAFLGHPITGDMKSFVAMLEDNGFSTEAGKGWFPKMKCKYLRGDFWNFPTVRLSSENLKMERRHLCLYSPQEQFFVTE